MASALQGVPPGYRAPGTIEEEESVLGDPETPFTDEPPSYGLENTYTNASTHMESTSVPSTPPATHLNLPRRRVQTTSNPIVPPLTINNNSVATSSGGGFAAQFYPHFIARSVQRDDIPTTPARQGTSSPDAAPFSAVRMAFTQAVAPVAMSVGGSPRNTVCISRP